MSTDKNNPGPTGTEDSDAPEPDGHFPNRKAGHRHRRLVDARLGADGARQQALGMSPGEAVIGAFRTGEPGWQLRLNEALKVFLKEHDPKEL